MSQLQYIRVVFMNVFLNVKDKSFDFPILKDTHFSFQNHHFYMLIAPSGTGKTTLFNMLIGEDFDYDGEITYDSLVLDNQTKNTIRKDYIGILFQNFKLCEQINSYENVLLSATLSNVNLDNIDEKIKALFKYIDIEDCLKKDISQLSMGQKQRVAFARVMIREPRFIICDEPTGNLDENNEIILMNYLKQYYDEHDCTIVVATHNQNLKSYATDVLTIQEYQIMHCEEKNDSKEIEHKTPVQSREYSLFHFFKAFFEKYTLHYAILSFFLSICMIGLFISFNFGHTLIQNIETFLSADERNRMIMIYADEKISSLIPADIEQKLGTIKNVQSINFSNYAFGRYGLDKAYQSIYIDGKKTLKEENIFLSTDIGTHRVITEGREVKKLDEVVISKNFLDEIGSKDVLGKRLKMKLPLTTKFIQRPIVDKYGEFTYVDYPQLTFYEDSFKIVGICKDKEDNIGTGSYEIFFNEDYINVLLKKVAQPLNNQNEKSNQDFFIGEIISNDAKHNEEIVKTINKMNIGLYATTVNNYESLQYIVQEKDIFLIVEFLIYIVILYSIIEILKLNYKYKKDYLYNMQLLGCSNKDIKTFYVIESMLLFILSSLITYTLNIIVLNGLNVYFLSQNFISNIMSAIGEVNFVYMDISVFSIIIIIHLIVIILLQYFYYKKTIGGNER